MRIIIDVKTGVDSDEIEKIDDRHYLIRVKAERKKGKANVAALKLLRKHFGRPARIISGHTSSRKIIELL
ncbi:MAG: DUF167 domain-containing protein [Candidatus Bathyarchaeota archaeon]|nr:MAG: DUF167 domain-containing protein [Candidatus Bathyarchaeota archaeon]